MQVVRPVTLGVNFYVSLRTYARSPGSKSEVPQQVADNAKLWEYQLVGGSFLRNHLRIVTLITFALFPLPL